MRFICPKCGSIVVAEGSPAGGKVLCGHCSAAVRVPQSPISPGAVINDFVIEKEIGSGGMGTVFRAEQMSLERPVALKVLLPKYAGDAEFVAQFIREARAAAKLNHPNIVQAYAVGEEDGIFYFAMELIEGPGTMKAELQKKKVIPVKEAAAIIRDIADALHFAWCEARIVHHDIKPDNIMVTSSGRAKLADLGLAKVSGEAGSGENDGEVLGTPQYINPEQLTGATTDVRSDIYSLGATFYHFVTGKFPFSGENPNDIARKHLDEELVPPEKINPDVPPVISRIICRMMEKDPARRFQTADAVSRELNRFLEENSTKSEILALKRLREHKLVMPPAGKKLSLKPPAAKPAGSASAAKTCGETVPGPEPEKPKTKKINYRVLGIAAGSIVLLGALSAALLILPPGKTLLNRVKARFPKQQPAAAPVPGSPRKAEETKPSLPAPPKPVPVRAGFSAKVRELEVLFQQKGGSPEFLEKGDAFFFGPLYPGITPEEQKLSARIFEIYNRTDERLRMAPARRERARRAQEESDRRRTEELRRQEAERQRVAQEQEQRLIREQREREKREREAARLREAQSREKEYFRKTDAALGTLSLAYAASLRSVNAPEFQRAADAARREINRANADLTVPGRKKRDDAMNYIRALNQTLNPALQAAAVFTGKRAIPYQFEARAGELVRITGPGKEFGTLQTKSVLQERTLEFSLRDPDFRARLTRLLAKRMPQIKDIGFYFDLADGAFSPEWIRQAPPGWWRANASRFVREYLRGAWAGASDTEKTALRVRYGKLPEFKAVIRHD